MKPQTMSAKVDLHYSLDDKGWYFQKYGNFPYSNDKTSQIFPTKEEALKAWYSKNIMWIGH